MAATTTIGGGKGQSPVRFRPGALHSQLGVPQGEKIPAAKMAAAKAGRYGPMAQRRANFATGMLAAGRRTAARRASAKQQGAVARLKRGG
jgi:hypothetical protein